MRKSPFLPATTIALLLSVDVVVAQDLPEPGIATGTVDGEPFEIGLDCSGWDAAQRMVYAEGDDRRAEDANGDGMALSFSHFAPANATDGTVTLGGSTLTLNAGFRPGPEDPQWQVNETGASYSGPSRGTIEADVSITIDCAPRVASARGVTGVLSGTIDGLALDTPLYCDDWDNPEMISARTDDGAEVMAELDLRRESGEGTLLVEAGDETYQIVIAGIAGTEAEINDDSVAFAADLRRSGEGWIYSVDLTFDCANR